MNTDIWETIMYHCKVCDAIKIFNLCRAFQAGISDNVFREIAIIIADIYFGKKQMSVMLTNRIQNPRTERN